MQRLSEGPSASAVTMMSNGVGMSWCTALRETAAKSGIPSTHSVSRHKKKREEGQ
jgi:hypothetical protein